MTSWDKKPPSQMSPFERMAAGYGKIQRPREQQACPQASAGVQGCGNPECEICMPKGRPQDAGGAKPGGITATSMREALINATEVRRGPSYFMYAGQIVEKAPARELFEYPLHPYTLGLMNSFPSISGLRQKLTGIPGSPPDLITPPSGCSFHPRCSRAFGKCSTDVPVTRSISEDHSVACHLFDPSGEVA